MSQTRSEKLANYSTILIAVSALVVSVWQVRLFQEHNKLSVKPYLDYHLLQEDSTLTVSFSNKGLGPAIVKDITFGYQEKQYPSLSEVLKAADEQNNILTSFNYGKNSVTSSGEKKLLVKLVDSNLREIKVTIIYETIYEERDKFEFSF